MPNLIFRPRAEGYKQGYEQGQQMGLLEGRALGREKGFELWNELGYYKGVVSVYKRMLQPKLGTYDHV